MLISTEGQQKTIIQVSSEKEFEDLYSNYEGWLLISFIPTFEIKTPKYENLIIDLNLMFPQIKIISSSTPFKKYQIEGFPSWALFHSFQLQEKKLGSKSIGELSNFLSKTTNIEPNQIADSHEFHIEENSGRIRGYIIFILVVAACGFLAMSDACIMFFSNKTHDNDKIEAQKYMKKKKKSNEKKKE
ncbi:5'-adenylylsulfate reductase-like 7 [Anaeramoeba flamelloides]|uniref:5'-adenylylsulfate reductase-like 7 n=1 Tax=Anaeramoeba flamelloides TaxID=1746091 RepID=A0ABQ8XQD1_9EUKA|nr:5'-adenylylsulfate reductase-like 7 [Anaeramoeba flamelloides]